MRAVAPDVVTSSIIVTWLLAAGWLQPKPSSQMASTDPGPMVQPLMPAVVPVETATEKSNTCVEELMAEVEHWIESEMHRLDPEAYPTQALAQPAA